MLRGSAYIDIEQHDAVKRRLRAKGILLSDISEEIGCTPSLVTMVCQGKRSHVGIEQAIARHLGDPVHALWPLKYKEVPA